MLNHEYLEERKAQRWRALAIVSDGTDSLICLGQNILQIKESYISAYEELITDYAKKLVKEIRVQRWQGLPCKGHWRSQCNLPIPN